MAGGKPRDTPVHGAVNSSPLGFLAKSKRKKPKRPKTYDPTKDHAKNKAAHDAAVEAASRKGLTGAGTAYGLLQRKNDPAYNSQRGPGKRPAVKDPRNERRSVPKKKGKGKGKGKKG